MGYAEQSLFDINFVMFCLHNPNSISITLNRDWLPYFWASPTFMFNLLTFTFIFTDLLWHPIRLGRLSDEVEQLKMKTME